MITFKKLLIFSTIIILGLTISAANVSACYFENTNVKNQGEKRLAIILPSIIPERTEVTLKIISVVDYKDKMEFDSERNDKVNVSVLWSSAACSDGSEKSVLVQLDEGSKC